MKKVYNLTATNLFREVFFNDRHWTIWDFSGWLHQWRSFKFIGGIIV
jgi:hypothetical protein